MKKVLIIFGYKLREYEYLKLLEKELQKKEFDVRIRYMNFECYHEVFSWKPDFVLLNQVNQDENIAFAKYCKNVGVIVVVMNAELLYFKARKGEKYAIDCDSYVDYSIECGDKRKYFDLIRYSRLGKDKFVMLGSPKFDMYTVKYRKSPHIMKSLVKRIDKRKRTICICTSFQHVGTNWNSVKNNIAYIRFGQKNVEEIQSFHLQMRDRYIALAKKLASLHLFNIIFRVHPLEDISYYAQAFKNDNIILENSIAPSALFQFIDVLIHRSSTIALEAWIVGVPTITYEPVHYKGIPLNEFAKYERVMYIESTLVRFLKKFSVIDERKYKYQIKMKYLKHEFGFDAQDTVSASQRIAHFLSALPVRQKRLRVHIYLLFYYVLNIIRAIFLKKYIYEFIGLFKGKKYLETYKINYV